jgi:D-alanyl-D-alanine dipeptidase
MAALDRVRLVECGEPLVDLRVHAPMVLIARPTTIPWARERIAEMLVKVASVLPSGIQLGVTEAWRPLQRQKRGYDWFLNKLRDQHPDWSFATLKRQANRFFHPYDRKAPPGHCTGGAVDVRLYSAKGRALDLISPYRKEWWPGAPTYVHGLTPRAYENRMTLVDAMLGAGFSNCLQEFWHYSFGDAAWAVRVGSQECYYGWAYLDEELWREAEKESIKAFLKRK